jgi:DNA repair protein RAD50
MTSLDKLAIQGVRSYNPDDEQVIQFLHPLTIILGQNGSGKTVCGVAIKMRRDSTYSSIQFITLM